MRKLFTVFFCCLFLAACDTPPPTADQIDQARQEKIQKESSAQVGMPGITNFTEKKLVRELYEARDRAIATHTYIPDMNGRLWHLCESIGFGLPYGVQFSSPHKVTWYGSDYHRDILDQAEPNGLFMPPTAEGTWVFCADPKGKPVPTYVEPRVITSQFLLNAVGEYQAKQP